MGWALKFVRLPGTRFWLSRVYLDQVELQKENSHMEYVEILELL